MKSGRTVPPSLRAYAPSGHTRVSAPPNALLHTPLHNLDTTHTYAHTNLLLADNNHNQLDALASLGATAGIGGGLLVLALAAPLIAIQAKENPILGAAAAALAAVAAALYVAATVYDVAAAQAALDSLGVLGGIAAAAVVAVGLYFIYGTMVQSPEEREESGSGDLLTQLVYAATPSPWRKSFFSSGDGDDVERPLLDLPAWMPDLARESPPEPECIACLQAMRRMQLELPSLDEPLDVCYWTAEPPEGAARADAPPVLLIHGFDSSVLEFRFVVPRLVEAGLTVHAMDWWTGGFTDREPFNRKLAADKSATPWALVNEQHHAFWKATCGETPVIALGASLGGAPAMDFAVEHPEAVSGLVLMDAGGFSYAQPPPAFTAALAGPVANFFAWRGEQGLLPFPHLWRTMPGWREALQAYLESGGYQVRVDGDFVPRVPQRTLVLWGEEDDVLPVEDADKYGAALQDCARVTLIPDAQHAPALENPEFVADAVAAFVKEFPKEAVKQPALAG